MGQPAESVVKTRSLRKADFGHQRPAAADG